MLVDIRKVIAVLLVGAVCSVFAVRFIALLAPAHARSVSAACAALRAAPSNESFAAFPAPALAFTASDYQGQPVSLSSYLGEVVLVNFWASWCDVCSSEKPSLEALQAEFGDSLRILALASDSEWAAVRKALPGGSAVDVLLDPPPEGESLGAIARGYGITAVPESFLIDRKGKIRHYFINKRDWSTDVARTCLRSIVDEAPETE